MRSLRRKIGGCLCVFAGVVACGVSQAQVSAPTPKDLETAPPQFRAEVTGQSGAPLEPRRAPAGMKPETAPHDFTGAYSSAVGPTSGTSPGVEMPAPGDSANRGCLPALVTGVSGNPTHVVSGRDVIVIVQEENHLVRRVYLNAEHPKNLSPSVEGHSIGRFEGDTLIIETVGLKSGRTVVERLRKIDAGRQIETVANGRASLANWRPDLTWVEDICEDAGELFGPQYPTRDWLK
jgi:hypothetical protein